MSAYYVMIRPFGLGSRVKVEGRNLTVKGAVKKFKALGYDVKEEDVKPAPIVRPVKGYNFHLPTYPQEYIDMCKEQGRNIESWMAKVWNTDSNTAAKDAKKAYDILQAADIDCNLVFSYMEVYKDTNTAEGLEFAERVVDILRKPKKELK